MARTPSAEYLVLDIETVPDVDRWKRPEVTTDTGAPIDLRAPSGSSARPPSSGLAIDLRAPSGSAARPPSGGLATSGAFPPTWAHRIVVIGCLWLDHGYRLKRLGVVGDPAGGTGSPDERERALLEDFSRFVGRARPVLVTYNGRAFDLPVIALRALCHGTPLAWYYREPNVRYRYSQEGHLDLCDWLADHGATRSGSLDAVARLIGLPGKVGVDGSQVEGLYRAGQLAEIQRYCLADVAQTALLFLRFRLLQGVLRPDQYQEVTSALLDALAADGRVGNVLDGTDRAHLLGPTPAAPATP